MKKITSLILAFTIILTTGLSYAATKAVSKEVYSGIANYKKANYTGCIQDMQEALKKNPNDIFAKYYLALVYTKIGLKDEAKKHYEMVVNQGSEKVLVDYSKKALSCLDNPQNKTCFKATDKESEDISKFIESGEFMHPELKKSIQQQELKNIQETFNADKKPNMEHYNFINDAKDELEPTDAQIAAAVKILAKVGYNPMNMAYMNQFQNMQMYNNPQLAQLSMLSAGMQNNNNNDNNNNFVNLLPYLMAQKNSQGTQNISPELIQSMLMNQGMSGFDFGSNN